jgi:hypothetical protein
MDFVIRQAAADDADAVVRMHIRAHEECYGHLLPSEFFAARRAAIPERVKQRRPYLDSRNLELSQWTQAVKSWDSPMLVPVAMLTGPRSWNCSRSTR